MQISIISAMGENRVIGDHGKIPWHLPADFRRFKDLTMGHSVIMGRKTFESIGKPLPGRKNIVISHDAEYKVEGATVVPGLTEAFRIADRSNADDASEVFILGGGQIYQAALPFANKIYLTQVHGTFKGDVIFPEIDLHKWNLVSSEPHAKDENNAFDFDFLVYEKKA